MARTVEGALNPWFAFRSVSKIIMAFMKLKRKETKFPVCIPLAYPIFMRLNIEGNFVIDRLHQKNVGSPFCARTLRCILFDLINGRGYLSRRDHSEGMN